MIKKEKLKSKMLKLCAVFLFPVALFAPISLNHYHEEAQTSALEAANYIDAYQENVEIANSSFTQGSFASSSNNLSGWSAIETSSNATGMFVDVGTGTTTDETGSNSTFSRYRATYMLETNPGKRGNNDTRILMINSKSTSSDVNVSAQKGYRSESITLEANSYYSFTISVKTATNGDQSANASIYVNGLVDRNGNTLDAIGYENILNQTWTDYHIFIATGDTSQTVTIDLYLGSAHGGRSSGVVFFDEIRATRYSENAFFETCYDYGYQGIDTYQNYSEPTCFLVNDLQSTKAYVELNGYNLDFENPIIEDTNTLGNEWSIVKRTSSAHAVISKIKMQPASFTELYGYTYIGDDLSYDNSQGMILYTDSEAGYVGVRSQDIEIKAHNIYKISFNVKVTEVSGSFYLKVQENDNIYSYYPQILSNDENNDNYYQTQSGQTSGISSNTTNAFTNDYQTVDMYVKGHSLYDSSINIELWLGDETTTAEGCVIVDNIEITYADYEDFSSASNSLELKSFSSTPSSGISNPYFNASQFASDNTYPITASDWTTSISDEDKSESGIIYLYDNESYKALYSNKYTWAGIYPGHPNNTLNYSIPNNVYMMFNSANSYQSITSSTTTLSSNSYYKISFDYYNQNTSGLNPSQIKVELIDSNDIVIFTQEGLSSLNRWNNVDIFVKTAETVSNDVSIKISLGDEDNLAGGIVCLDNFLVETSTENNFNNGHYTSDLSDYYFSITENGEPSNLISSSPAYQLTIDQIYDTTKTEADSNDCAIGGLVSGVDNPYIVYDESLRVEDSNLLVLQTMYASSASLTSNYTLSLSADSYYLLSFDLATLFNDNAWTASTDDHNCQFGLTVEVEGFEQTTQILATTTLQNYKFYLHCNEAVNPTIKFTLVSDCNQTLGTALITHLNFTAITESEYNGAQFSPLLDQRVFTPAQSAAETDDSTEEDDNTTTSPENEGMNPLLLISSIIMGVVLIVAIVGFALRRVKIKKIEKVRKESYDRKLAINHDAVLHEAQKRRDAEFEGLTQAKQQLLDEKSQLEQEHKEYMREARETNKDKITKQVEKTFKKYTTNIARLDEKINIIDEKIKNCMSAEYLLSIQRNIIAEQEKDYALEKKATKTAIKQQKLQEKKKLREEQTIQKNSDKTDKNS